MSPIPPRVGAIVLAAGRSRRMGGERNKMLLPVAGKAMVCHVVDAIAATRARPIVVVVGHQAEAVQAAVTAREVGFVVNRDHESGIASSIRAGIGVLRGTGDCGPTSRPGRPLDGALICLGDMCRVPPRHIDALLDGFQSRWALCDRRSICVPTYEGRRGNPVLFGASYFDELLELEGDSGARALLLRHAAWVVEVPVGDDGVLVDADTPAALAALPGLPVDAG